MKSLSAALVAALLVLGACATGPNLQQRWDARIGMAEWWIVSQIGPPTNVYQAPDGSRVLTFSRSSNMQFGGQQQIQPVTSTTTGTIGNTQYRETTTTYQTTQQTKKTRDMAKVMFRSALPPRRIGLPS